MAKLTDKWLRAKLNKISDKESTVTHNGVIVRISRTGKITFGFRYRFNAQRKKISLGSYPEISLADAVNTKNEALRLISQDKDPAIEKKKIKLSYSSDNSFSCFFEYWYRNVYLIGRVEDSRKKRAIEVHFYPIFADLPVKHITYSMVMRLLREKAQIIPVMTKVMISMMKQFWRWLAEENHIDGMPIFEAVSAAKIGAVAKHSDRILDPDEIRLFWSATTRARLSQKVASIGQICLLTGCRYHEFQLTGKHDYDIETGTWTIQKHKTVAKIKKPIVRIIGSHAQKIMEQTLNTISSNETIWLYEEGKNCGQGRTTLSYISRGHIFYIKNKLHRDIPSFSLHDLRRTCRSLMTGLSAYGLVHADAPRLALGHVLTGVDKVYNQWDYTDLLREAYEVYEELIMYILSSEICDMKEAVKSFVKFYRENKQNQPNNVVDIKSVYQYKKA